MTERLRSWLREIAQHLSKFLRSQNVAENVTLALRIKVQRSSFSLCACLWPGVEKGVGIRLLIRRSSVRVTQGPPV